MLVERKALAALAALPLLLGVAACSEEDKDKAGAARVAATPCPDGLDTDRAAEELPPDFPSLSGARLYRLESQGKTKIWYATLDGGTDDLVPVRDRIVDGLKGKGYDIEGTDQEQGAEAEAEFKGPHEGTVRTRPLCDGHVEIRYKLES